MIKIILREIDSADGNIIEVFVSSSDGIIALVRLISPVPEASVYISFKVIMTSYRE